jgi:hypothetical protein
MKTTAIVSRLLRIAGLHLPVVRTTNKEMLIFLLTEHRASANELAEFYRDSRGGLRWLRWATRAVLIHSAPARSLEFALKVPAGCHGDSEEEAYELTKRGERGAHKALNFPSLSDRYHAAVWRRAHLEEYRPRRYGRLAVAGTLGLAGYIACLPVIFHGALAITGLKAELGEVVCLVLPITSVAVAVGLARVQRSRNEAEEDGYFEELGTRIKEELQIEIESGEAASEEHREDCAGLGYDPTAL